MDVETSPGTTPATWVRPSVGPWDWRGSIIHGIVWGTIYALYRTR